MHNITLKNIPSDLYEQIKMTAHENRRSINNEIISRLDNSLRSSRLNVDRFLQDLEDFQKTLRIPPLNDELLNQAKNEGRS